MSAYYRADIVVRQPHSGRVVLVVEVKTGAQAEASAKGWIRQIASYQKQTESFCLLATPSAFFLWPPNWQSAHTSTSYPVVIDPSPFFAPYDKHAKYPTQTLAYNALTFRVASVIQDWIDPSEDLPAPVWAPLQAEGLLDALKGGEVSYEETLCA